MGHAILQSRESGVFDRIWVCTDSPEIAGVAEEFGVRVPWLRPPELAQDGSQVADALKHLLERLKREEGYHPDAVMIVQATSPFRTPETIRKAVDLFIEHGGESVITVSTARSHPYWCYRVDPKDKILTPFQDVGVPPARQKLPPLYCLDGSVFLVETSAFLRSGVLPSKRDHGLVIDPEEAVDIDGPLDWMMAETLWSRRQAPVPDPAHVFIIAEAGVNHNGDLKLASELVLAAKKAGADAIKFQTFSASKLVSRNAAKAPYQDKNAPEATDQLDLVRPLELSREAHLSLRESAHREGIIFLSTPFDEDSADLLDSLGVPLFKLPSGEITNKLLLQHVARKNKPLILSTGMSSLEEVARAVGWIREVSQAPLTLLHCVTEYPAPADQSNLRSLETMRRAFGLPVGWSDHTLGLETAVAAAALGAGVIEKHLTMDRDLPGPDHKASLEPEEFAAMVRAIRSTTAALGDGLKRPAPCEAPNRVVARRSLVAARALAKGHVLARADFAVKRPGTGIPPFEAEALVGRTLGRALAEDEVLTWEALA